MKWLKIVISIGVGVAAVLIVWRVGFYPPVPEQTDEPVRAKVAMEPNEPAEAQKPIAAEELQPTADVNEPEEFAAVGEPNEPNEPVETTVAVEPNEPGEPNEPMVALNLKDVEIRKIVEKLGQWTGKVVIPDDEAMKQKITIYAPKKLSKTNAISKIYSALRMKGYVAEEDDDSICLKPLAEAKLGMVPTIPADQPLALIENKEQIVQKFFKMKNYSPVQMGQIVQPLIGEYGYVSSDETTRSLLVIDTVTNLIRIERIIVEFDVPEAEQALTEIFEVQYGDPSEIVQMLNILLGETEGRTSRYYRRDRDRGRYSQSSRSSGPSSQSGRSSSPQKADSKTREATSVVITSGDVPVVLIPEPRRKWIIAKASAEGIRQIGEWIKKLDKEEPVESDYETVQLRYADPREVESAIEDGFEDLPGTEFLPSVLVEALENSRQVMIFGRKDLREMVKKMIEEIDIPPGQFVTEHFKLKYADPDQVKLNIEELYEEGIYGGSRSYGRFYSPWSSYSRTRSTSSEMVKVISYVSLRQITVIASSENMKKIEEQIAQWDAPLDVEEVKPRIIELHNSDPLQMADLLNTLFSEGATSSRVSVMDLMFRGLGMTEQRQKIVGPLYGQLTFEHIPGTKKIIVISKIPEAYSVIEALIRDIDSQEMAEVPRVITLNYADPEDLAQRLNAVFNEQGTVATIQFGDRGLSEYSMTAAEDGQNQQTNRDTSQTSQGEYRPWWTTGRTTTEQKPISNVIGRVRFIPDPRSKSILVLAPSEFMDNIEQTIKELDIPGKQVMIKAVVMQIDHSSMTSLGLQLSSDPTKWSTLDNENAITAFNALSLLERHGALVFGAGRDAGTRTEVGIAADVTALIDFLVKQMDAKILNQQTLWTKDNEEAEFFKGQRVGFQTEVSISEVGGRATSQFEYEKVGMTLRTRPNITPEKNVDMVVNVILSQLTSEEINNQRVRTEMDTTTNMIVQDGQTIMLGGILFQEKSTTERKIPLFGDMPLVGGLFRHNEAVASNNEMLIFVTPYVIDEPGKMLPETKEQIERSKQKLEDIRKELGTEPTASEKPKQKSKPPQKPEQPPTNQDKEIAKVYYRSLQLHRQGRFEEARQGFLEVTKSGSVPPPMQETIQACLRDTEPALASAKLPGKPHGP